MTETGKKFNLKIFQKILELPIGIANKANEEMFALLSEVYPLTLKRYPSDTEHNGWVIPRDWDVTRAEILKDGILLFDGTRHPLAVAGYSTGFSGKVTKNELDKHVFSNRENPDSYPFHCVNNYRPWAKHWGFCIPFAEYNNWTEGEYEVDLEVDFQPGEMIVGEAFLPGESKETIVFNAHTCHPCQANDDMAGVFLILELFKWLSLRKRKYSYLAVLGPEHLGTVFYIAGLTDEFIRRLKGCFFIEMPGTETPLLLQKSFFGDSVVDRVSLYVLKDIEKDLRVASFREDIRYYVGNDETVWEAAGIEVPTVSISRWPYEQYHTSADNLDIISADKMMETFKALQKMVEVLEIDHSFKRKFKGLIALSNPKFNLYIERWDPTVDKKLKDMDFKLGRMQDHLPRYLNEKYTVFDIAEKFDVPFDFLVRYLSRFKEKGLVEFENFYSLDRYQRDMGTYKV